MAYYDIIGDVHGCGTKLELLLAELGYQRDEAGVYRHPERTAVFVGDLIDRGKEQLKVLQVVKGMVDAGTAKIVMGNHEFNAIAWATENPDTGKPLREHNEHNHSQHEEFLEQLSAEEQAYWVEWFKTLPLWLDLGGIRVVHACWHEKSMAEVEAYTGSNMLTTADHYAQAALKNGVLYDAIETLLKGPEISLIDHGMPAYYDHEAQKPREKARLRWWARVSTLPEAAVLSRVKLADKTDYPQCERREIDASYLEYAYHGTVPLFYGHYWREWEHDLDEWTTYTACVDFSATRGGTLVAYRWSGEPEIHWSNYVPHDPAIVAPTPSDQTV